MTALFPFIQCTPLPSESSETTASKSSAGFFVSLQKLSPASPSILPGVAGHHLRLQLYFTPSPLPQHHSHVLFVTPRIFSQEHGYSTLLRRHVHRVYLDHADMTKAYSSGF